ncbi:MAG: zinc ribbon domain-containing protein [Oscillospiraceae bacterium]|nr:zinc ribbon domain-containing protein [Oscillospiraceae bacterium]
MNKFEDLFYEFKGKAKDMYGAASKATSEAVDYGKIRYAIKQTEWEIEKTYAKLGEVVYGTKKGATGLEDAIDLAVAEVDLLQEKLAELEARLRAYKNVDKCSACGKENDTDASFCSSCGAKLEKPEATEE